MYGIVFLSEACVTLKNTKWGEFVDCFHSFFYSSFLSNTWCVLIYRRVCESPWSGRRRFVNHLQASTRKICKQLLASIVVKV
jgi:hypothetical protein